MMSIIIPAYNEEKRIGNTLEEYAKFFDKDTELLVVINNTHDNTEGVVKEKINLYPQIRYLKFEQGGKGFAIIEGFKDALKRDNDLIGFVDADLATSPEAYFDLVNNIGEFDGIISSRYIKGAVVNPKQSMKRILGSRLFNALVRILFWMPYRDTQCGAKVFKREAIEKVIIDLSVTQWAFDVNLLYKLRKNKYEIKEHPTVWADKDYSKMDGFVHSGTRMALACIRLRLINSKCKFIMTFYDSLPNYLKISLLLK